MTELARRMDLHKSTVSRLLSTLEKEDAVERVRRGYRISDGLATLTMQQFRPRDLAPLLEPFLYRLVSETGEAAGLSIADGKNTLGIAQVPSRHNVGVRDWTGERFPMHISSGGKQFLAHAPHFRREEYLANLPKAYTKKSITDPTELRNRLVEVRQQGYDWTFEEFEEGLVAASAPVFDRFEKVVAVIFVSGPLFRFPNGNKDEYTRLLVNTCREASELVARQTYIVRESFTI